VYVLDPRGHPLPVGIPGELYLGGTGLARGYLNAPDLTAAHFVPDPYGPEPGARLYRTGDRARWLPDGNLEFLGRIDKQLKVRGFRVEPGDIETALCKHPAIRLAHVEAREDATGSKRLVAYVVCRAADAVPPKIPGKDLHAYLLQQLPDHMVPAVFVFLDALPTLPNGKVNAQALPAPDWGGMERTRAVAAPRTPVEQQLAEIWGTVLGLERIGVDENFFELGGHSLLAAQMLFRVHGVFGRGLPLGTFFQKPTIRQMARALAWAPASRTSCLVPLRPQGSRKPLFCVHPLGGTTLCYFSLARHLDPHQPFYAVRAPELDGEREPHTRIEDMAACYVAAILAIQPEGPYLLGGWSLGGVIAFEMARQLHGRGLRVALVALLDTESPGWPATVSPHAAPGAEEVRGKGEEEDATLLADLASDLNIPVSRKMLRRLAPGERLDYVLRRAGGEPGEADVIRRTVERYFSTCKAQERALAAYRPTNYPGPVTLFRCRAKRCNNEKERAYGWDELVAGGVQILAVPGSHQSMVTEPRVRVLARKLQACIDRALETS
jgi:thioesterase domain-containing protein